MEAYPRTLVEFEKQFATEGACRLYLEQLRWPDGFRCPGCGGAEAWRMGRGLWLCERCRRQISVTVGTVFERSRLPLSLWFRVMWHVTNQKNGASALTIQRLLDWGATKRLGRGCTNCAGRWCVRGGIAWKVWSKPMRATWAERSQANVVAVPTGRPWCCWLCSFSRGIKSVGSVWLTCPMP